MALDLSSLEMSVGSLREAFQSFNALPASTDPLARLLMRDGVIQRFKRTIEPCWKMLKCHLEETGLERVDTFSIKELFRVGYEQGLVKDPAPWFDYIKQRNMTSHTYDEATAQTVFQTARLFLPDAADLLSRLKEKNG